AQTRTVTAIEVTAGRVSQRAETLAVHAEPVEGGHSDTVTKTVTAFDGKGRPTEATETVERQYTVGYDGTELGWDGSDPTRKAWFASSAKTVSQFGELAIGPKTGWGLADPDGDAGPLTAVTVSGSTTLQGRDLFGGAVTQVRTALPGSVKVANGRVTERVETLQVTATPVEGGTTDTTTKTVTTFDILGRPQEATETIEHQQILGYDGTTLDQFEVTPGARTVSRFGAVHAVAGAKPGQPVREGWGLVGVDTIGRITLRGTEAFGGKITQTRFVKATGVANGRVTSRLEYVSARTDAVEGGFSESATRTETLFDERGRPTTATSLMLAEDDGALNLKGYRVVGIDGSVTTLRARDANWNPADDLPAPYETTVTYGEDAVLKIPGTSRQAWVAVTQTEKTALQTQTHDLLGTVAYNAVTTWDGSTEHRFTRLATGRFAPTSQTTETRSRTIEGTLQEQMAVADLVYWKAGEGDPAKGELAGRLKTVTTTLKAADSPLPYRVLGVDGSETFLRAPGNSPWNEGDDLKPDYVTVVTYGQDATKQGAWLPTRQEETASQFLRTRDAFGTLTYSTVTVRNERGTPHQFTRLATGRFVAHAQETAAATRSLDGSEQRQTTVTVSEFDARGRQTKAVTTLQAAPYQTSGFDGSLTILRRDYVTEVQFGDDPVLTIPGTDIPAWLPQTQTERRDGAAAPQQFRTTDAFTTITDVDQWTDYTGRLETGRFAPSRQTVKSVAQLAGVTLQTQDATTEFTYEFISLGDGTRRMRFTHTKLLKEGYKVTGFDGSETTL
ncbi:MAG: hypothetical protein HY600_05895, partial [Candidatus Omnitrophica bacterium]|nr:hypothetical protein [Candidatus Omnitrophota bacterium]